jgi:uncharacterized C2H2 Zn-finger protein
MGNYKYKTTEKFIYEAKLKHDDKYDYSLVNYVNAKTKVKIICPEHGVFNQIPRQHICGSKCPKCSGLYMDIDYFKEKSNKKHNNKYNYSLVIYNNSLKPVKIICPIHGEFNQRPKDHLIGKGCQKCSGVYMDTNYFKEKANKIHGFIYSYDKTIFKKANDKVIITCLTHGDFRQTPNSHLNKSGCPICRESKGEKTIRAFLISKKINFIKEYKFNGCKNINPLPFDFYLPDHDTCIEYNGEQHYKSFNFFGGDEKLIKTQINDKIKLDFCKSNKLNLIIINNIKNIEKFFVSL